MATEMEESLCRASIGEPCEVLARMSHGRRASKLCLAGIFVASGVLAGCGVSALDARIESMTDARAKAILRELPYRYDFRRVQLSKGASAVVAGRVYGSHRTRCDFGISIGKSAELVPMPHAVGSEAVGGYGFLLTNNELVKAGANHWVPAPQCHTKAQWDEASHMATEVNEKFCFAIAGKPCPV
jgi:hypothetical protein